MTWILKSLGLEKSQHMA